MGISSTNPLLASLNLKGRSHVEGNNKALEAEARRRWKVRVMTRKRPTSRRIILMKTRARLDGSRRPRTGVEKRVRTLKKLLPNSSESNGLNVLFRETAAYILSLQTRVKAMQILVDALSSASSDYQ